MRAQEEVIEAARAMVEWTQKVKLDPKKKADAMLLRLRTAVCELEKEEKK